MGVVLRQSIKTSLIVALGSILGAIMIWLSTKFIPKQQYGFIGSFTNYVVTVSQILIVGLNSVLVVYIHRYTENIKKTRMLLTVCLLFPLITFAIASLAYYLSKQWVLAHFQPNDRPFMDSYYMWLPLFTVLFLYMTIMEQYLGSQMKVAAPAFIKEVALRILNIVLILLFAFGHVGFQVLIAGTVLIYIVPVFLYFILAMKNRNFGFSLQFDTFTWAEYKEIFHFAWYHFLLSITILLMAFMDAIALPFYDHSGFNSVAIYRPAVFLISFLLIPSRALMPASFTTLAKAFADNDIAKATNIFSRASINIFIVTMALALLLICNLDNIVAIIQNGYNDIKPIFLILFLGKIIDCSTGMNDQVLSITNHYKFNFYLSLSLSALLFLLLRTLIPAYGVYGAAWSTTITVIIFNICKFLYVWLKLHMQPFSRNTLLVLVAAAPALAAGYFFPHLLDQSRHVFVRTFADASMRSAAAVVVYVTMLLWLKPSADLQEYITSIKKNKRLF